ncbi:Ig-like domain-containing protein [Iodobacter sp.]|uniref:Ig-like domain-containing protein n=1 Tax=Iodobacter sp. TaxID=1915058 RepID=UPI0025EDB07E|nr:Ig-like domain-containing protein [Iodobacter sp.]
MEQINFNGKAARKVAGGLLLLATIMLTACNGSSGDGSSTTTPTPVPNASGVAAKMEVLANTPNLASDGNTPVVITARVKNANNVVLEGQTVIFSTQDSAQIAVLNAGLTDKTGSATANVTTGSDQSSRSITIKATAGTITEKVTITVSGTKITLNGSNSLVLNKESSLTISLKDAAGKGVAGQKVALASALGNTFKVNSVAATEATTGDNGQATITYQAIKAGADIVKTTALGESATLDISISNNTFDLTPSSTSQGAVNFGKIPAEVNLDSFVKLELLYSIGGTPQSVPVTFTATRGNVVASSSKTDANGKVSVTITSTTAGASQITATANGISNNYDVEFVATAPSKVVVQPDTTVVRAGASTAITAIVRDASSNLVKNQVVNFNLVDPTGGRLSIGSGMTNSSGQTSTNYTAGNSSSAKDGVTITATLANNLSITSKTQVTVGGKSLFIRLGTGNQIEDKNSTQNITPYSVIVTDAAGNPVAGVQVTLAVIPTNYLKGVYRPDGDSDGDGKPDFWLQHPSAVCLSEDKNNDGILDPGEDDPADGNGNGNGRLEPGFVATVYDALNPSSNTVKTDETGSAFIKVLYGKNYSSWTVVKLQATIRVEGSEYSNVAVFNLPGLAKDYTDIKIPPPGVTSPFGIASVCTNPN